ncbi:MAG: hypothetical protein ABUS49_03840 [Acidobacteriota bacterium]
MRTYYPGVLMIPLLLLLMAAIGLLNAFGIIHFARVWSFWPVTLIATGLEELYLWSTTKNAR